jgi:hypothetical protein
MLNTCGRRIFKMAIREGWEKVDQYGPTSPGLLKELGYCIPKKADWIPGSIFSKESGSAEPGSYKRRLLPKAYVWSVVNMIFVFDQIHAFDAHFENSCRWLMPAPSSIALPSTAINTIAVTRSIINAMLKRIHSAGILENLLRCYQSRSVGPPYAWSGTGALLLRS